MNTVFVCNLAILVVVLSNYHQGEAALTMDDIQMVRLDCIKEANLNAEETSRIMARELFSPKYTSTSDPLKCYVWCSHKKINGIDASMKFNMDVLYELFALYYPDKKDKIKSSFAKCSSVKETKPCELSYEFHGCSEKNLE